MNSSMDSVINDIERWHDLGLKVVLARIIDIEGSAPRLAGATMAVNQNGEVAGSLSGGCVESSVVDSALSLISNQSAGDNTCGRVLQFDAAGDDEVSLEVGLTCGGKIEVFIEPLADTVRNALIKARDAKLPLAIVTIVEGDDSGKSLVVMQNAEHEGSLGSPELDASLSMVALNTLETGECRLVDGENGSIAFIQSIVAPPHLVIVGAVDFTAALTRMARVLGYRITVCDARETFATSARFPEADEVVVDWPHRFIETISSSLGPGDAVCVLTHDHKYDIPAIVTSLNSKVGYIGAMGSRKTHGERKQRLIDAGVSEDALTRIMAPIGLDIGASTPEEVAIAICAEIIAARHDRIDYPVMALRDAQGPIHRFPFRT